MKDNFAKRIQKHIKGTLKPGAAAAAQDWNLRYLARNHIHQAVRRAQDAVARCGYFLGIVTDTDEMISAKLFPPGGRSYLKSTGDLVKESGFPINLQINVANKTVTIYSGQRAIVSSGESKKIEKAVYQELEEQIKSGVDALKEAPRKRT